MRRAPTRARRTATFPAPDRHRLPFSVLGGSAAERGLGHDVRAAPNPERRPPFHLHSLDETRFPDERACREGGTVNRNLGLILIGIGAVLTVLSVLADPIGIGKNEEYVFGWKQALGTAVGVLLAVVGAVVWRRSAESPSTPP